MARMGSRRAVIVGTVCTLGAGGTSRAASPPREAAPPLKRVAPTPAGCCLNTSDFADGELMALFTRNFSQVTPGWEMKMGYIARPDGGLRFDAPDAIAAFARRNGLGLHGHTLVWHKLEPVVFTKLSEDKAAFATQYRRYIAAVAGRYRNAARGWDVVNEPVRPDGGGLRNCLWSRVLGPEDHMLLAFQHAADAAPETPLFVNDYGLEDAGKRATLLRLVERLLRRGAPIGGLGTQAHINIDLRPGALRDMLRELSSLGLLVHVSELDISFGHGRIDLRPESEKLRLQADRAAEIAGAYLDLKPAQRYAFTLWGVRDKDSWLNQPPFPPNVDRPLAFSSQGQPKPMLRAIEVAFARPVGPKARGQEPSAAGTS